MQGWSCPKEIFLTQLGFIVYILPVVIFFAADIFNRTRNSATAPSVTHFYTDFIVNVPNFKRTEF